MKTGDKVRHILGYEGVIKKEFPPHLAQQVSPATWQEGDIWWEYEEDGRIFRAPDYELMVI